MVILLNFARNILLFLLCFCLISSFTSIAFAASPIPSSFDARELGWVTSVKSQKDDGNCWAYAVISVLETDYIAGGYGNADTVDFSENYLTWFSKRRQLEDSTVFSYGDGEAEEDPYGVGGCWFDVQSAFVEGTGITPENAFPPGKTNFTEEERYLFSDQYTIQQMIRFEEDGDPNLIKQWILNHGSVSSACRVDDDCLSQYNGITASYTSEDLVNHEIQIIGWDDTFSLDHFTNEDRPSQPGAWLCKNSWSERWGDQGYVWISYEDASLHRIYGYDIEPNRNHSILWSYNGVAPTFELTNKVSGVANVYSAPQSVNLHAISLYLSDQPVCIQVYTTVSDFPQSGQLALETTFQPTQKGYYTIPLKNIIHISQNTKFSIIVLLNDQQSKETTGSFYIENQEEFGWSEVGESFGMINGYWFDLHDSGGGNAFLSAHVTPSDEPIVYEQTNNRSDAEGDAVSAFQGVFFERKLYIVCFLGIMLSALVMQIIKTRKETSYENS